MGTARIQPCNMNETKTPKHTLAIAQHCLSTKYMVMYTAYTCWALANHCARQVAALAGKQQVITSNPPGLAQPPDAPETGYSIQHVRHRRGRF